MSPFLRYPLFARLFARRSPIMEPLIAIVGATGTGKSKVGYRTTDHIGILIANDCR
ncbi:hypothetical protein BDV24DRAFT_136220 [Aspergillus arachidicola]|uniref:tRNA dimethylallyltransferase n=1 Tax=Aspergillus arachidicola TaxID=656916 RepID=A0A5N6Y6H2_9EURO|nr:hypothetical protein BDV24DRAFT_136220 [Aspergillus arachidicola]